MPTVVQWRRGTTTQNNNFTGALGEISVDTTLNTVRVHDGVTAGGYAMMTETGTATLTNKTLSAPVITGTLTAGASTGTNGQFLQSTGSGIQWATLSTTSISNGTSSVSVGSSTSVTTTVGGSVIATVASTGLSVTGTITATGLINTTGNISAAVTNTATLNVSGTATATAFSGPLTGVASTATALATPRAINGVNFDGTAAITVTAAAGTLTGSTLNSGVTASSLTSVGTLAGVTVSSTIAASAHNSINIGASGTTFATVYATTFSGVSTTARYADLAENYASDKKYVPGTVVVFGGSNEITISTKSHDPAVAGVISTDPAYLMNSEADGLPVALQGRVPCRVQGPVMKGDRLVTSDVPGVACILDKTLYEPGCIIGKALEYIPDGEIATIEVVVGRV